ncbi:MAG TPA: copper resistance protein CopC, partial [Ktedonobacteraceae bacterium]|nr:copper resistance protein CopC [Ktedonobacteraceae bacterium]
MRKANHIHILAIFISIGLFFAITGTAAAQTTTPDTPALPAHASVTRAIPAIGSTISQAPTSVTIFTAENINPDPKVSNLFVYGPVGAASDVLISQGNAQVSITNPEEMSINITPNLQHVNGVYVVHWITKSALDGDPDEGAFIFTVNTGAAATATPAATTTSSTGQITTPPTTNTSGG